MAHRTLEITLQYARDLNNVNLISKMEVYAVVSISGGDNSSTQKTKTPADREGNANPSWNFPMRFVVDEAALQANRLTLDFKLVCARALGDKDVGEVQVPMKELIGSKAGAEGKQFVSYQIRKPNGKPKGQLSFSYQFGEKSAGSGSGEPVTAYPASSSSVYPPPTAYPAVERVDLYPPPTAYPAVGSVDQYPPATAYPAVGRVDQYPPAPPVGYGYPPPAPGYGYPPPAPGYVYPPQQGYGYPAATAQRPAKKNKLGMGLGAGLLGGALGGLLVGDMMSDGGGFDCGGGFDF